MHNLVNDLLPKSHFEPRHELDKKRARKIEANTALLCQGVIAPADFLDEMASDENCKYFFLLFYNTWITLYLHFLVDVHEYDDASYGSSDESSIESSEYSESSDEEE